MCERVELQIGMTTVGVKAKIHFSPYSAVSASSVPASGLMLSVLLERDCAMLKSCSCGVTYTVFKNVTLETIRIEIDEWSASLVLFGSYLFSRPPIRGIRANLHLRSSSRIECSLKPSCIPAAAARVNIWYHSVLAKARVLCFSHPNGQSDQVAGRCRGYRELVWTP